VFDVAPIWDQYEGAKTLGEPTAVEKVIGIGVGNYKRLTIDPNLINNVRSGPFLILDLEDLTVANIEEPDYLLVFVDGVLQKEGISYNVSGPNIFFEFSVTQQMKVDMRYLYGRDVGQILNLYDYNVDQYYANSVVVLETTSGLSTFELRAWMGNQGGSPIQAFQIRPDGTYNIIGQINDPRSNGSTLTFECFGYKAELIENIPVTFAVKGRYSLKTDVSFTIAGSSITYEKNEDNNLLLRGVDQNWRGSYWRKTYKNPFISLSNGSSIRVEGESNFRKIKELPSVLTSKEQRPQEQVSDSFYGQVNIGPYSGVTRGEGLSIVAILEYQLGVNGEFILDGDGNKIPTGKVKKLEWNQRSYDPITQPTAYQYYTPPVINFLSEDGYGGGARAQVIVSKGQVISVELITGGSGYIKAPKVVVARRYDVIEDTDIGVSLIDVKLNLQQSIGFSIYSTVSILGNRSVDVTSVTSTLIDSPVNIDKVITAEITPATLEPSSDLTGGLDLIRTEKQLSDQVAPIDTFYGGTEINIRINNRIVDIESSSTFTTSATREITNKFTTVVENNYLSNVNYFATGSFLQAPLSPTDTIIYVADTSKFNSNGYLLIGGEIVRYLRKLNDRFLMVERGVDNTTAQSWSPGTFIRQVPDPVSVASAGISIVESESQLVTVNLASGISSAGQSQKQVLTPSVDIKSVTKQIVAEVQKQFNVESISTIESQIRYKLEPTFNIVSSFTTTSDVEIVNTLQSVQTQLDIQKTATEVLLTPPPSGVVDGYQESIFIENPIKTRLNGFVTILDDYGVVKRDGTIIYVNNSIFGLDVDYVGNYTKTNVGHTIGHFEGIFDDGAAGVSGLTLSEIDIYFKALTIKDFEERSDSSYTLVGDKFNLMPPSIQNPVAISSSSGTIGGSIVVQDTTYFPSEGYLFTSGGTVIQYTGKTTTEFTGCTLYNGPNSINATEELIPFTI